MIQSSKSKRENWLKRAIIASFLSPFIFILLLVIRMQEFMDPIVEWIGPTSLNTIFGWLFYSFLFLLFPLGVIFALMGLHSATQTTDEPLIGKYGGTKINRSRGTVVLSIIGLFLNGGILVLCVCFVLYCVIFLGP